MTSESLGLSNAHVQLGQGILRETPPWRNVVISPTSILAAMALLHDGSTGTTKDEIATIFAGTIEPAIGYHFGELFTQLTQERELSDRSLSLIDEGEPEFTISPANSIWLQEGYKFERSYIDHVESELGGDVRTIEMIGKPASAAKYVNEWVDKATRGRIRRMVSESSFSELSRVLVCNALYFKANWMRSFAPPIPGEFHLLDGSIVMAQMISGGDVGRRYASGSTYWAIELGYVNDAVAMLLIVPSETGEDALIALEERLPKVLDELSLEPLGLFDTCTLPEFSVSYRVDISEYLRSTGIEKLFSPEAELSGICNAKPLWIDAILHACSIDVDRYGTEAAAVTMAVLLGALPPPKPLELVVDRPFVFLILDKPTGALLYLGRVADPTAIGDSPSRNS